jgi:archaellum component FlaC
MRRANNIQEQAELLFLINEAADKLFFLSNKSQEQITEEYKHLSLEVSELTSKITIAVEEYSSQLKSISGND